MSAAVSTPAADDPPSASLSSRPPPLSADRTDGSLHSSKQVLSAENNLGFAHNPNSAAVPPTASDLDAASVRPLAPSSGSAARPDGFSPADSSTKHAAQQLGFQHNSFSADSNRNVVTSQVGVNISTSPDGPLPEGHGGDTSGIAAADNPRQAQDFGPSLESNHTHASRNSQKGPMGRKPAVPKRSFADAAAARVAKPPDLFTTNLKAVQPIKHSDGLTVLMPDSLYEQQFDTHRFAVIGRILMPRGTTPRTTSDFHSELVSLFQTSSPWTLLPLGKGFFSLKFTSQEDKIRASRFSSWKLSSGAIHLREWKPDFNPNRELSTTVPVWVRLFNLPTEYWHPEFLAGIFRSVGHVIKLDGNTAAGLVGHFARALVEVDLTAPLLESVRVGRPGMLFYVDFSYENLPELCTFCHIVGHSIGVCRRAKAAAAKADSQEHLLVDNRKGKEVQDPLQPQQTKKQWVAKGLPSHQADVSARGQDAAKPTTPKADSTAIVLANKYAALQETVSDLEKFAALPPFDKLEMITGPVSPEHNENSQANNIPSCTTEVPPRTIEAPARKVVFTDPVITQINIPASPIPNEFTEENAMRLAQKIAKMAGKTANDPTPIQNERNQTNAKGSELVQSSLTNAYKRGATPTAYSLEPGDHSNVMNRVASHRWSDEVDTHIASLDSLDPTGGFT